VIAQRSIEVNGFACHYAEAGDGPPLVLVHGLAGSGLGTWGPLLGALARDFRVIAPDSRGAGASEVTPGPYSPALLADDLVALIAALGLDAPVAVGHSMGASVCLLAAAHAASPIRAVVGIGVAFGPPVPAARAELEGLAAAAEEHGMGAVAEGMATLGTTPALRERDPDAAASLASSIAGQPAAGVAARARGLAAFALDDELADVPVPVRLLAGEADPLSPWEANVALAARLSDARLAGLGDCAHEATLDRPEALVAEVRAVAGSPP
jgi:3-oxoadipate enol-lactonase